jgi:hypothetical protein
MSKRNLIIIGSIVVVVVAITFGYIWRGGNDSSVSSDGDTFHTADPMQETPPPMATPVANTGAAGAGFLPTEMVDPNLYEAFNTQIADMAKCTNLEMGRIDKSAEINFETFNQAISQDLGDVVAQEEDWSTTDIRTPTGEIRRILIQTPPPGEGDGERKLKYMSLSPDGKTKDIPVSQDQSDNPSDTLLASLESDGQIVGTSKANRIFYENGDDLYLSIRNGKVYSFTLNHEGKVFRCKGMDSGSTVKCSCE